MSQGGQTYKVMLDTEQDHRETQTGRTGKEGKMGEAGRVDRTGETGEVGSGNRMGRAGEEGAQCRRQNTRKLNAQYYSLASKITSQKQTVLFNAAQECDIVH